MKLSLYIPVKPFKVNQMFGANPAYYAKFHDDFGEPEKGHMGLDLQASHGEPVYAAHDGLAHYELDAHGGDGIFIQTFQPFDYGTSQAFYKSCYWHMCSPSDTTHPFNIPTDGKQYSVRAGDLLGYADNSGAPFESSGDHLHLGLIPCDQTGEPLEPRNGFGGNIDPLPFLNGLYAQDIGLPQTPLAIAQQGINIAAEASQYPSLAAAALSLIKRLGQFISQFK